MAAPSVTFDGTRVNDADALGSIWTDLGGGKCASEPDFVYQGVAAVSEKVGTSEAGVALDMVATVDYTTPLVWIAKHIATNSAALNAKGSTGGILEIGSGGRRSDYDRYYVVGGDTYPLLGGWLITPIDPNGGNQSARPGTAPTLTAIDYYGWACDFSATSKSENVAMDAVDYLAYGQGLTLIGGDGASADGTFQDFIDFDEDAPAASNNRYGIVSTREGVLYVTGFLNIGTATETDFTDDTGAVIVWPDAEFLNSVGFFGLGISLANASSVIAITNAVFISRGTTTGTVDTRADFVVTNTSGALTLDGCRFANMRIFTLTSAATVDGCDIETAALTQATAEITNSTIRTTSLTSVAAITDPTFGASSGIHDTAFVQAGAGHALELSAIGATVTLTNVTFSGYGADTTDDAAIDVTAASGTTTINWSGGTEPTYKTAGATVDVVNAVTVRVTVDDSAGDPIENARVLLTEATADTVTITRATTTATVAHTTHGYATGDEVAIIGANEPEYNGVKTITVTGANAYTYTVSGSPATPATGTITAQIVILNGLTNASGIIEDTGYNYASDLAVSGRARKSTASPFYKTGPIAGTILVGGFATTVFLIRDD